MVIGLDTEYVDILFEGRNLQLRVDQITVNNLTKTFRLIPQTVILVSTCGTVALPDVNDGLFYDLDPTLSWTVEGDKSSTSRPGQLMQSTNLNPASTIKNEKKEKWKPTIFPSRSTSSRQAGHRVATMVP